MDEAGRRAARRRAVTAFVLAALLVLLSLVGLMWGRGGPGRHDRRWGDPAADLRDRGRGMTGRGPGGMQEWPSGAGGGQGQRGQMGPRAGMGGAGPFGPGFERRSGRSGQGSNGSSSTVPQGGQPGGGSTTSTVPEAGI